MELEQFKDTVGGVFFGICMVAVLFCYRGLRDRYPRITAFWLISSAFAFMVSAHWLFTHLGNGRLEETFTMFLGFGSLLCAFGFGFMGARKLQRLNDLQSEPKREDAIRALRSLDVPRDVNQRIHPVAWILATVFALAIFGLFIYQPLSSGIWKTRRISCRIPEDTQCTLLLFGFGLFIAVISTAVLFFATHRFLRWVFNR